MTLRYGMQAARLIDQATEIEKIRTHMLDGKNQNALIGLDELKRLHFYASKLSYKNAHNHPELATLCLQHKKSEEVFEKALAIIEKGLKSHEPAGTLYRQGCHDWNSDGHACDTDLAGCF